MGDAPGEHAKAFELLGLLDVPLHGLPFGLGLPFLADVMHELETIERFTRLVADRIDALPHGERASAPVQKIQLTLPSPAPVERGQDFAPEQIE